MKDFLVAIGGLGSAVSATAAATPCCLPLLASVAGIAGLSALLPYYENIAYFAQLFGLLAVVGAVLSLREPRKYGPLALTVLSVGALLVAYNISLVPWLLYSALAGLVAAATWNMFESKRCNRCVAQD